MVLKSCLDAAKPVGEVERVFLIYLVPAYCSPTPFLHHFIFTFLSAEPIVEFGDIL